MAQNRGAQDEYLTVYFCTNRVGTLGGTPGGHVVVASVDRFVEQIAVRSTLRATTLARSEV